MKLQIIKQRSRWWGTSAAIILAGIAAMIISAIQSPIHAPLQPSLDFVGGTRLQVELDCTQAGNPGFGARQTCPVDSDFCAQRGSANQVAVWANSKNWRV
jgi:preprotein translocase subunit SecF